LIAERRSISFRGLLTVSPRLPRQGLLSRAPTESSLPRDASGVKEPRDRLF